MESHQRTLNISLSDKAHAILEQSRQGTNLTTSDVIELIITMYFRTVPVEPEKKTA